MPLTEDEQRRLQEIGRALYEDDPKFARRIRAGDPQMRYERKLLQVLLGVVIGLALLLAGAATHLVYLQAAGVMMVALLSLVWAVVSWRQYVAGSGPPVPGGTGTATGTKRRLGRAGGPGLWSGWKSAGVAARRVMAGCRGQSGADGVRVSVGPGGRGGTTPAWAVSVSKATVLPWISGAPAIGSCGRCPRDRQ